MTADQYNPGWYNHGYPALPFVYDKVFKFVRKANFFIENVALYKSNFSEEDVYKRHILYWLSGERLKTMSLQLSDSVY